MRRQEVGAAARDLLACYAGLARRSAHLLDGIVPGRTPVQWEHYPADDAVDRKTGYQYFYHCHAPERRRGAGQHGHFHLFVRLDGRRHRLDAAREARFLAALGGKAQRGEVLGHLLAVGLTPKGVPCELFTVNQWVTGDRMLSAHAVLRALAGFEMRSGGDRLVNRWLRALLRLFDQPIAGLIAARDRRLLAAARRKRRVPLLEDRRLEVLSRIDIDVDARLRALDADVRARLSSA